MDELDDSCRTPMMPAAGYPSKMARSSSKAICREASLPGRPAGAPAPPCSASVPAARPALPLKGQPPVPRRLDVGYVAGAHAGQHLTGGAMHIYHPPPGQVALDG